MRPELRTSERQALPSRASQLAQSSVGLARQTVEMKALLLGEELETERDPRRLLLE